MAGALSSAIATARRNPAMLVAGAAVGVVALAVLRPIQGGGGGSEAPTDPAGDPLPSSDLFGARAEFYEWLEGAQGGGFPAEPGDSPTPESPPVVVAPPRPPSSSSPGLRSPAPLSSYARPTTYSTPTVAAPGGTLLSSSGAPRTTLTARSPLPGGISHAGAEPRRLAITHAATPARYVDGRLVTIPAGRRLPIAKGELGGEVTHVVVAGPFAGANLRRHSSTYIAHDARELAGARTDWRP